MSEAAQRLCLAAAGQASEATARLIELGRHGIDADDIGRDETVEKLADALKMTIEASNDVGDPYDSERNQLHGAIVKFLEGWAG